MKYNIRQMNEKVFKEFFVEKLLKLFFKVKIIVIITKNTIFDVLRFI